MDNSKLTLDGVRVIEFTHAIMGPSCGLVLADLGAEVIRIERAPDGDPTRYLKGFGTGYYTMYNRNKKSIAVDIKADAGKEIVLKLIETADVLIENFAPGTMDRLGYGFEAVHALNPRLIYCSLKGFMDGPYEKRSALDEVVQMMSGLAYMTGPSGQPLRAGASIVDIMGGTFGALGVLVALRDRETTGEGQHVKNGLFETAAYIMGQHMAYSAIAKIKVPPMSERVSAWGIYRPFDTADGEKVFIGVTSDKHWESFCKTFAREDLLSDQRLATNNDRVMSQSWLFPDLEAMFAQMSKAEIIRKCDEAEIPFAPISRPEDLFDDPQLNEGMGLLETMLPSGEMTKLPRLPLMFDDESTGLRLQPPKIGEHTEAILRGLGYDMESIADLKAQDIIA